MRPTVNVILRTLVLCFALLVSFGSSANARCLSILTSNFVSYWVNGCSVSIYVNWSDQGDCSDWSCSDHVGPNSRETESMRGKVDWCECQGDTCFVHGPHPCRTDTVQPGDQETQQDRDLEQSLQDAKQKAAANENNAAEEELKHEEQDNINRANEIRAAQEQERRREEIERLERSTHEHSDNQPRQTHPASTCKDPQRYNKCVAGDLLQDYVGQGGSCSPYNVSGQTLTALRQCCWRSECE
jgi:hypothetical protein